MLKKILLAVLGLFVVAVAAILGYAATQPDEYRVERQATIAAPPAAIAAQLDDFHAWAKWSPYEKLDPQMVKTFSGAPRGPGARYDWFGNDKAGKGRMTLTRETPSELHYKLEFMKPFESVAETTFLLAADGGNTRVTWRTDGNQIFIGKVMCLFIDMDHLIGKDFETGLTQLKHVVESGAATK